MKSDKKLSINIFFNFAFLNTTTKIKSDLKILAIVIITIFKMFTFVSSS